MKKIILCVSVAAACLFSSCDDRQITYRIGYQTKGQNFRVNFIDVKDSYRMSVEKDSNLYKIIIHDTLTNKTYEIVSDEPITLTIRNMNLFQMNLLH